MENGRAIWYLSYLPLLALPFLWFTINNELFLSNQKLKRTFFITFATISLILFLLVVTNDMHELIFVFDHSLTSDLWKSNYSYNFGYFIIYAFIYLQVLSTIVMFFVYTRKRFCIRQKLSTTIIFILLVAYSILYVLDVDLMMKILYLKDYSVMYCLFAISLCYFSLKAGLIKNSGSYQRFFEVAGVPLIISTNNKEVVFENEKCKIIENEKDFKNSNFDIGNGKLTIKEDIGAIKKLQNTLIEENNVLKSINNTLQNDAKIKSKIVQYEQRKALLDKMDRNLSNQILMLKQLLDSLPDKIDKTNLNSSKEKLNQIKFIVGYLKRKSSLLISETENRKYSADEIKILFNESFADLKSAGVVGALFIENDIKINIHILSKFYEVYHKIIYSLLIKKMEFIVTLNQREKLEFTITFIDYFVDDNLMPILDDINYVIQKTEDGMKIIIREADI